MRTPSPFIVAAAVTLLVGTTSVTSPLVAQAGPEVVPLADGVDAIIRREPFGLAGNANSLVIIGARGVLVVDAQFTRQATLETIAAIRNVTRLPVRWVVNTHWHDDHLAGNQVYRDSFPGVRFIQHANTVADLETLGAPNRAAQVQNAPPVADRFERFLAAGLGIDSTPASDLERASVESAIRIIRQYVMEAPGFQLVTATDTVRDRLTLPLGGPAGDVEVRWFGCGNTRGDLVVVVPRHHIVASGDLVVAPVPFAFGSYPASWVGALDSLLARRPRIIVPGHGPVMRDPGYVVSMRRMLARAGDQAAAAAQRGDSLGVALRTITLEDDRRRIAGDEKWLNVLFANFFLRPTVMRAYEAARQPSPAPGCPAP